MLRSTSAFCTWRGPLSTKTWGAAAEWAAAAAGGSSGAGGHGAAGVVKTEPGEAVAAAAAAAAAAVAGTPFMKRELPRGAAPLGLIPSSSTQMGLTLLHSELLDCRRQLRHSLFRQRPRGDDRIADEWRAMSQVGWGGVCGWDASLHVSCGGVLGWAACLRVRGGGGGGGCVVGLRNCV